MLKPGMRVTFQRPRRKEVEVEVRGPDPRGFWIGFKVENGRVNRTHLRTFKLEHVTAIMTEDGPRCVFREVL
ncbi:MAG TPA: hypothetical protein DCS48_07825 [Desulfovibrio sp.]|nr:hypothetical protein [Desulfovibrio sp.]